MPPRAHVRVAEPGVAGAPYLLGLGLAVPVNALRRRAVAAVRTRRAA